MRLKHDGGWQRGAWLRLKMNEGTFEKSVRPCGAFGSFHLGIVTRSPLLSQLQVPIPGRGTGMGRAYPNFFQWFVVLLSTYEANVFGIEVYL